MIWGLTWSRNNVSEWICQRCGPGDGNSGVIGSGSGIGDMVLAHCAEASVMTVKVD